MAEYVRIREAGSSRLGDDNGHDFARHRDSFEHEDLPLHEKELDEKPAATTHETDDASDSDDSDLEDIIDVEKQSSADMPKWTRYNTYGSLVKSWCVTALPRFCQSGGLRLKGEPHPTAWLDALRGYAAWIVFQYHAFNTYDPSWRRQPFVSILFAGPGMVALFFVISGYVLSYSLLKQIRNRQSAGMLESLASSTFRRYLRLYVSSIVATVFAFILIRLGWYNPFGIYVPSFLGQVGHWLFDTIIFINPFGDIRGWYHRGTQDSNYLSTLWTIPVEFRGSMILFGFCAAVCKLTTPWRMALTWLVILLCYVWNSVFVAEFLYGLFVADLSLLRNPDRLRRPAATEALSSPLPSRVFVMETAAHAPRFWKWNWSLNRTPRSRIAANVGYSLLFLLGIFLLGEPDGIDLGVWGQFPWRFLKSFIPFYYTNGAEAYWYLSVGGFFLVLAIDSFPALQRPLMYGFSQYVGDLSFGIYVLHPPVTIAFYHGLMEPWRVKHLGSSPLAFIPGFIALTLMVFILADYFSRLDKKVVRLGRWLQAKLFRKWDC
ncbi:hypothetical protein A1O3_09202 [Capronia epimyces CBS 606.96]|uniref:Acyltransferase 3 domain-containing protein n=1 Tax=Capronia epimyces CBS 606.96 TaxID=1182542 RepID=W9XC31_9EURO|nr:uncharacterized protein A1O3_09202 [Capronia epimyces CBS 606.96]EXJ78042.1 hypothetical protein A1O3_09202 [Capronia epimyces CBS 606.96]